MCHLTVKCLVLQMSNKTTWVACEWAIYLDALRLTRFSCEDTLMNEQNIPWTTLEKTAPGLFFSVRASCVSVGAGSGSWRSWPGRASAYWPALRLMRTRLGWDLLAQCSSCWSLRWEPDCSISPGLSRRQAEWIPPSVWSWWGQQGLLFVQKKSGFTVCAKKKVLKAWMNNNCEKLPLNAFIILNLLLLRGFWRSVSL